MKNFNGELRKIINSFDSCLYEQGDGHDICGISNYRYEELVYAITELVKRVVPEERHYMNTEGLEEDDEMQGFNSCRTEMLKRLEE